MRKAPCSVRGTDRCCAGGVQVAVDVAMAMVRSRIESRESTPRQTWLKSLLAVFAALKSIARGLAAVRTVGLCSAVLGLGARPTGNLDQT